MNKITFLGMREHETEHDFNPQTDYQISMVFSRVSREIRDSESDDKEIIKYKLKLSHIENIKEIGGTNNIKFEKGKSPSQKLRFRIEENVGFDYYQDVMNYLINSIDEICDNWRENEIK